MPAVIPTSETCWRHAYGPWVGPPRQFSPQIDRRDDRKGTLSPVIYLPHGGTITINDYDILLHHLIRGECLIEGIEAQREPYLVKEASWWAGHEESGEVEQAVLMRFEVK